MNVHFSASFWRPLSHIDKPVQILYSLATQRFSRSTLFNIVILTFMAWFVAFGLLYPSHESIHFHGLAEDTLKTLPSGLAGAVGMVRCMHRKHSDELVLDVASVAKAIILQKPPIT